MGHAEEGYRTTRRDDFISNLLLLSSHPSKYCLSQAQLTIMPGTIEEDKVEIPVIDLNSPNAPEELLDAAARYGFIFVKHDKVGLEPAQVDSMFQLVLESRFRLSKPLY